MRPSERKRTFRAGHLRELGTLVLETYADNGAGGRRLVTETIADVPMALEEASGGREGEVANAMQGSRSPFVTVRYRPDLSNLVRVVINGRTLRVVGVPPAELGRVEGYARLRCEEQTS